MSLFDGVQLVDVLVWVLGGLGLLWYFICLFSVGIKPSAQGKPVSGFRQFESLSITTISVSLATFIGSLLGSTQSADKIEQGTSTAAPAGEAVLSVVRSTLRVSDLQWACAILYVLSLVVAMFFWYRGRDNTDPAISNLAKSLLGVVGGALSIALKAKG